VSEGELRNDTGDRFNLERFVKAQAILTDNWPTAMEGSLDHSNDDNSPKSRAEKPAVEPARAAPVASQVCRLCRRPRVLRDSHFIPAAFYLHLGLDHTGTFQNRALQKLTRSRFARVPGQTKKHLLCDDCEERLSANGESWVTRFAHQVGRGFRLQEALLRLEPRMTLSTGQVYFADDDPAIDWRKLAYFAFSIFWRGAADSWARSAQPGEKPFIDLDPTLQEHLRLFLLGEADHPDDILLMLRVSSSLAPDAHMMSFPSNGTIEMPDGPRPQTTFFVPGMIFTLVPGPDLAEEWVRQGCLIRGPGHPILVLNSDQLFFREAITLALTATPSQKILDEAHALWREALTRR
jgi:hypothetical protein